MEMKQMTIFIFTFHPEEDNSKLAKDLVHSV
jgi:hypothetical protein